jgi:hypothetical protein
MKMKGPATATRRPVSQSDDRVCGPPLAIGLANFIGVQVENQIVSVLRLPDENVEIKSYEIGSIIFNFVRN